MVALLAFYVDFKCNYGLFAQCAFNNSDQDALIFSKIRNAFALISYFKKE